MFLTFSGSAEKADLRIPCGGTSPVAIVRMGGLSSPKILKPLCNQTTPCSWLDGGTQVTCSAITPSTVPSVATATYRNHARRQPRFEISHVLEEQQPPDSIAAFRLSAAARLGRDEGAGSRLRLYRGCMVVLPG
jgi:hypothetical protein